MEQNAHVGSSFDEFLDEEGVKEEVTAVALKQVIARKLELQMQQNNLTKSKMAKILNTSRSQLDRLLSPNNVGVSFVTLFNAAKAVNCSLYVDLRPE